MEFHTPSALETDHEAIHQELSKLITAGGKVGEAAQALAEALHPHFRSEEQYAMPPLSLLAPLAEGKLEEGMFEIIPLVDHLKSELPQMLAEHQAIIAALGNLKRAGENERNQDALSFVERLTLHAQTEEQVYYPAAILVGDYLRLKREKSAR